jgi:hypothetical protein
MPLTLQPAMCVMTIANVPRASACVFQDQGIAAMLFSVGSRSIPARLKRGGILPEQ